MIHFALLKIIRQLSAVAYFSRFNNLNNVENLKKYIII